MKYFLIKYQFKTGSQEEWHKEVKRFITALESDPELKGKISYRCMKSKDDSEYYHLAAVADDQAVKELGERDYFKHYTEQTDRVSAGGLTVSPLEIIAQTELRG
ncbi:MAG TPA: hypothetical protein VII69_14815 [Candidatus Eremiobacteraceae bacterium]